MPMSSRTSSETGTKTICLTVLRNCRAAMTPTSRLLIIEPVPRGQCPSLRQRRLMTLTGGAERTARETESLLARARLTMTRVVPTITSASNVEAQLASAALPTPFLGDVGDLFGERGHHARSCC